VLPRVLFDTPRDESCPDRPPVARCDDAVVPTRRRGPILLPVVLLAAVLIVGGLWSALRDDDGEPKQPVAPSVPAEPAIEPAGVHEGPAEPPALLAAGDLMAYRLVYRVEAYGSSGSIVDTEVHEVRRSFEARVETRTGEPPGTDLTTLSIWGFGFTEIGAPGQQRATLIGEPVLPGGEAGVTGDLTDAIDAGSLVYREQQQAILGRDCYRYRTGGPVDVVRLTEPTRTDFADLCIDDAGLVLSESWVVKGQLFRRRTAVELDTDATFDDNRFQPTGTAPVFGEGGGLIGQVTPDSQFPDVVHWALPAPPEGFRHRGLYSFTPAAPTTAELGDGSTVLTGLSDVYESGADAVIIVNGGTNDHTDAIGDVGGDSVDLGDLGTGFVRRRARGAEILVRLDRGRFVKVHGTLPLDDLVAIARSLVPLDGAGKTITRLEGGEDLPQPSA
jgi:hypothetical protein